MIYIKNLNSNTVLESKSNGKVVARNISDDEDSQLWDKGKVNKEEDFFTLKNSEKILSVNFEGKLEVKGKQQKSIDLKDRKCFLEPLKKIHSAIPFDVFSTQRCIPLNCICVPSPLLGL